MKNNTPNSCSASCLAISHADLIGILNYIACDHMTENLLDFIGFLEQGMSFDVALSKAKHHPHSHHSYFDIKISNLVKDDPAPGDLHFTLLMDLFTGTQSRIFVSKRHQCFYVSKQYLKPESVSPMRILSVRFCFYSGF